MKERVKTNLTFCGTVSLSLKGSILLYIFAIDEDELVKRILLKYGPPNIGKQQTWSYLVCHEQTCNNSNAPSTDTSSMRGPRKFFQRGSNFDNNLLVKEGIQGIQIPLKVGRHRPASETPFKWRFAGVPMMARH